MVTVRTPPASGPGSTDATVWATEKLHAEAFGLFAHTLGEFSAGNALGESGIVVDAFGGAGLAADAAALDNQSVHALAGGVDGGGETRRSTANDDQVVVGAAGLRD